MTEPTGTSDKILTENNDLKAHIEELEGVLRAIRSGEADAIIGHPEMGEQIFTLKGAETPYRHFVEEISEGALTLSREGTIFYANRGFAEIARLPPEEIIGSAFTDLVTGPDREEFATMLNTAFQRPISGELNLKAPSETDTKPVPVQLSLSQLSDDDYETVGGIVTDLTSRKQTEDIIRSERLARSILNQAEEAIVVCNTDGDVIRANPVAHMLAGTNPVRQPFIRVFPVTSSENMTAESMIQAMLCGRTFRGAEVRLENRNSVAFDLLFSGSPLTSGTDEILGSVIVLSDITEQKASKDRILYLNQVLKTIRNVNQTLIQESDPDRLLQRTCDIMSRSEGFENAWIVRFDKKGAFMRTYKSGPGMIFADLEAFLQQGKKPWCLREALQQESAVAVEDLREGCSECPFSVLSAGRITLTCSIRYKGSIYGVLSAILPEKVTLGKEDPGLFKEVCGDVAFGLHTIWLEKREARALVQIQQNLMQLATLNDEIRNPLTVIKALNDINMEYTEKSRKIIDEQIDYIDNIIRRLDAGWLNSEKIWDYLMKHHGVQKPDK